MYTYSSRCSRIVDGDTIRMACYQSLRWPDENIVAERTFVIRLLGLDCPEVRGATKEAGLAAKAYVRTVLYDAGNLAEPKACEVVLGGQRDVYGRWIGSITVDGQDLAEMIVAAGHGVAKDYSQHRALLMGIVR